MTRGALHLHALRALQLGRQTKIEARGERRIAQGTWTLVAMLSQLCRNVQRNYVQLVLELHFVQIFRPRWKRREGMSCLAHALSALSMNSSKFRQVDLSKGIDTTRCVMAQHVLQQKLQCKWNTWAPWEYECPSNTLNFRSAGSCSEFSSASCNVFGSPDFYFGKIAI